MIILPSSSYKPPQVRTQSSNVIQRMDRESFEGCRPPKSNPIAHTIDVIESESDPRTAKVSTSEMTNSPPHSTSSSSPSSHSGSSRRDSISSTTDFEDLYDSSDSEVVPLKISNSIKQILTKGNWKRERLPSLVIPSPSSLPMLQKLQKSASSPIADSFPEAWPLSPAALTRLATEENVNVLQCSTPSLDGSLNSEEMAGMTNPSTPDVISKEDTNAAWRPPIQLHPAAMTTLQQLSTGSNHVERDRSTAASPVQRQELLPELSPNIDNVNSPKNKPGGPPDVLSAISIPSPGGFFASLTLQSKLIWSLSPRDITPSTGTAERFYNFPWGTVPAECVERVVEIRDNDSDGPPTARQETYSRNEVGEAADIALKPCVYEYDEEYERKLKDTATTNISRTSSWLSAQDTYLSAIKYCNMITREELAYERPRPSHSSTSNPEFTSPSKKSVRFASGGSKTPITAVYRPRPPTNDPLFYHAFQHLHTPPRRREAFLHRHLRADALQAQRLCLPELHRAQLQGHYELRNPGRPQDRFSYLPNPPHDKTVEQHRDDVARADRERQALQQVSLSFWNLEGIRLLDHGRLLPKRASLLIRTAERQGRIPRVLDLGGQPTSDWGWAVALDHRYAKVYTAMPTSPCQTTIKSADWLSHRGPFNHGILTVDNTWTLPIAPNTFDVISARTLHTLLRTCKPSSSPISPTAAAHFSPKGKSTAANEDGEGDGTDEFDATLTELHRVLAPGGILHFSLLDAEVMDSSNSDSGSRLAARSVEFAVALRSRGYDPCASRRFLGRLEKAEFVDVERAWLALPLGGEVAEKAGGSSKGMETVAGMVGSLEWERWMLKLQMEMGKPEESLLEGVAADFEQARRQGGVGWTRLVGSARKAWV